MEKLGIERSRAFLLAKKIMAVVIPGLASIWRHAVRQLIMAAQGQAWDDPGPRPASGFRPGVHSGVSQPLALRPTPTPCPVWARPHLFQLEEAMRLTAP